MTHMHGKGDCLTNTLRANEHASQSVVIEQRLSSEGAFPSESTFGKAVIPGHKYIARLSRTSRKRGEVRLPRHVVVAQDG